MSRDLYLKTSYDLSRALTERYSTSFSWGIRLFPNECRRAVFSIYGFVRLADEIVDTFHDHDRHKLLNDFRRDAFEAIEQEVSLNPVLHAFQVTVKKYHIPKQYLEAFLESMAMDLDKKYFSRQEYERYIYGSAEVVGLMCLKVFCDDDPGLFERLKIPACRLGSAFQKVNFLRDIRSDLEDRQRIYLSELQDMSGFSDELKDEIVQEIEGELIQALAGVRGLPLRYRWAVYSVFLYYQQLLCQLKRTAAADILGCRARVSNMIKTLLLCQAFWRVHVLRKI